jgi:hypothetical protein
MKRNVDGVKSFIWFDCNRGCKTGVTELWNSGAKPWKTFSMDTQVVRGQSVRGQTLLVPTKM